MPEVVYRRHRERLILRESGDLLSVDLRWGSACQRVEAPQVLDLNGQGIAVILAGLPPAVSAEILTEVSFYWKGKKIGAKAVQRAFAEPVVINGSTVMRLRAIYCPPYARYYLPKELVVPVTRNVYRVDPGLGDKADGKFIRSVIGGSSYYQDRRQFDRLRVALEDGISVEVRASKERLCSGSLTDISSNGAAVLLDDATDLNWLRTKADELLLVAKGTLVHRKQIGRYTAVPVDVRHRRMIRLSTVFARNVRATFDENDPTFFRENQSVRLREKALYPTLIRALVSEPADVQFEVTRERDVIERIYKLRYHAYLEEGKIVDSDFSDNRMTDKFDPVSIQVCGRIDGEVVAAARIIPQDKVNQFEFEESIRIPELKKAGVRYAEVSRFCVGRFFRKDVNRELSLTLRLIGEVCRAGWTNGIDAFLITAYKPHVKLYKAIGFRPVTGYVRLKGFNYEYKVMVWDIDPQKTVPLYRERLVEIMKQTLGKTARTN